jgi:hypothetical protein
VSNLVHATVSAVRQKIPKLETAELGPEYSYHSLPLCVIDSVFSIGVRYINAQKAVESWCVIQQPAWPKFYMDGQPRQTITDLIRIAGGHDGALLSTKFFGGNKQRTSTRGGILKAEAVLRFAEALKNAGVDDFPDIRDPAKAAIARKAVSYVTGQGSGISFDYLMMMAGDDSFVKADRMICRFVSQAACIPMVTAEQAQVAVVGACKELSDQFPNLTPRLLDHLIWRYQRTLDAVRAA